MMASRQGVESKISRRNEKLISKRQIYSGKRTKDQITQIRSQQAGLGGLVVSLICIGCLGIKQLSKAQKHAQKLSKSDSIAHKTRWYM